jgi:cation transport protein ChaC
VGTGRELWIFGYGSLLWRPAFAHAERRAGWLEGWARRFWQGSPDHRGGRERPGRVVTLVPEADARCWGLVYRVEPARRDEVLEALDRRESGGFERRELEVRLHGAAGGVRTALVYVAPPGNPNYLGPAPLDAIAAQVRRSSGPSGSNTDYVLRLAACLRELGAEDPHVFELAARLAGDGPGGDPTR